MRKRIYWLLPDLGSARRTMDELLLAGRAESDEAKRKDIYEKVTDLYLTDLSSIPLYHPNWFYAAQAGIQGINIYPDGILRLAGVKPPAN